MARESRHSLLDLLALPLAVGGTLLLAAGLGRRAYRHAQLFEPSTEPEDSARGWDPDAYGIPVGACEERWIETPDGEQLFAWYCRAERPVASVLFCHGNRGNLTVSADIIPHLLRANLNVLFFDYRGYGKSSGAPSYDGVLSDGVTAARFHDTLRPPHLPSILYGFSLGGAVAAQIVKRHPFDGLILQSTFSKLVSLARLLHPNLPVQLLAGDLFDTLSTVRKLSIPLLVLHGSADEAIPTAMAHELFDACGSKKLLHIVDGGLHGDLYTRDADAIVALLTRFVTTLPRRAQTAAVEQRSIVDDTIDAALRALRHTLRKKSSVIASATR